MGENFETTTDYKDLYIYLLKIGISYNKSINF